MLAASVLVGTNLGDALALSRAQTAGETTVPAAFAYIRGGQLYVGKRCSLIIVDGCDYLDNYTQKCIINALLRILQEFSSSVRILLSTKSSAIITSLTPSIEDGLVAEIAFSDKRFLRSIIIKIWNKLQNGIRIRDQM